MTIAGQVPVAPAPKTRSASNSRRWAGFLSGAARGYRPRLSGLSSMRPGRSAAARRSSGRARRARRRACLLSPQQSESSACCVPQIRANAGAASTPPIGAQRRSASSEAGDEPPARGLGLVQRERPNADLLDGSADELEGRGNLAGVHDVPSGPAQMEEVAVRERLFDGL